MYVCMYVCMYAVMWLRSYLGTQSSGYAVMWLRIDVATHLSDYACQVIVATVKWLRRYLPYVVIWLRSQLRGYAFIWPVQYIL